MHITPRSGEKGFAISQARIITIIELESGTEGART